MQTIAFFLANLLVVPLFNTLISPSLVLSTLITLPNEAS